MELDSKIYSYCHVPSTANVVITTQEDKVKYPDKLPAHADKLVEEIEFEQALQPLDIRSLYQTVFEDVKMYMALIQSYMECVTYCILWSTAHPDHTQWKTQLIKLSRFMARLTDYHDAVLVPILLKQAGKSVDYDQHIADFIQLVERQTTEITNNLIQMANHAASQNYCDKIDKEIQTATDMAVAKQLMKCKQLQNNITAAIDTIRIDETALITTLQETADTITIKTNKIQTLNSSLHQTKSELQTSIQNIQTLIDTTDDKAVTINLQDVYTRVARQTRGVSAEIFDMKKPVVIPLFNLRHRAVYNVTLWNIISNQVYKNQQFIRLFITLNITTTFSDTERYRLKLTIFVKQGSQIIRTESVKLMGDVTVSKCFELFFAMDNVNRVNVCVDGTIDVTANYINPSVTGQVTINTGNITLVAM